MGKMTDLGNCIKRIDLGEKRCLYRFDTGLYIYCSWGKRPVWREAKRVEFYHNMFGRRVSFVSNRHTYDYRIIGIKIAENWILGEEN